MQSKTVTQDLKKETGGAASGGNPPIASKEAAATGANDDSQNTEEAISELEKTVAELRSRLQHTENLLHISDARLKAVLHSTSWKIGAPMRFAIRALRYAKRKLLDRTPTPSLPVEVPPPTLPVEVPAPVEEPAPSAAPEIAAPSPAYIVLDATGRYALSQTASGYTYIEPQRPHDLDARLAASGSAVSFAIVVPVYNTAVDLLDAMVSSVTAQWYPHWTLILVDDASTSEQTRKALDRINHPQIKLLRLGVNLGIAGATNAGLAIAEEDFVVFADHDDELTVDCLYELALCINHDQADFVYSDEDKLDELGAFTQPHFKPDWSPDTMMSTMFTGHISCVRRSLLEQVGVLRSEVNGCQDWDLVLRITEKTARISHVSKVLYHWRIIPESVASDIAAKPYVLEASQRVRADALVRRGLSGSVEPVLQVPGYFRINYHLQGAPRISIIIPTRDGGGVLRCCVESIQKVSTYRNFEVIILDNGSVDAETLAYLQQLDRQDNTRVIRHDAPFNFSELNNIGALHATGELLLFLNDDTEVIHGDWLQRMGGYAQLSHIGAVGAKLVYPQGSKTQHAGVINNMAVGPAHAFHNQDADTPGYFMRNLLEYNWLAVTGACLMMERKKFNAIGTFNTQLPIAYNDIELCIRAFKSGLFNVVCQAVTLVHHESVSRGVDGEDPVKVERLRSELRRLYEMHPDYYQFDPFHNPNLDQTTVNFEVPL